MPRNSGNLLTTKFRDAFKALPAWVQSALTVREERTTGVDATVADVDPLSSNKVGSRVVQERTGERDKVNVFLDGLPVERTGSVVLPTGQVATVTERTQVGAQTLTASATLEEGKVEVLGGVTTKETIEAPEVFDNNLFSAEKPDLFPEKFRAAIPTQETRTNAAGTAVAPTLTTGQLKKIEEQVKKLVTKYYTQFRSVASLPVTLTGSETTEYQQKATVEETLTTSSLGITPTALTLPGSRVENLGDGLYLKTEKTAPSVPTKDVKRVSRPESMPASFTAGLPITEIVIESSGTATTPTLGDSEGDLEETQEQVTALIKRVATKSRATTGYPTLKEYEWDARAEQFIEITKTIVSGAVTPSGGTTSITEGIQLNKWKSIQIVSQFRFSPGTITKDITAKYSFPDYITNCSFVSAYDAAADRLALALNVEVRAGPSGAFGATLTETFQTSSSASESPFVYETVGGTIAVAYAHGATAPKLVDALTWTIPPSLHGTLSPSPGSFTGVVMSIDGIGASSPASPNSGSTIITDIGMEKWRFGYYVKSVIRITVPSYSS